jgi:hypothetical protein
MPIKGTTIYLRFSPNTHRQACSRPAPEETVNDTEGRQDQSFFLPDLIQPGAGRIHKLGKYRQQTATPQEGSMNLKGGA